ncbi:major histocompatibility complex class I-related gene protein-like isoform X2 [Clinocottus analis]|uniref:major histocompatibility complex class I-related gene protein-like isoform X2 n=1 Tax=Clinocottus analis TaxID=304258 RepID=UPI0035C12DFC
MKTSLALVLLCHVASTVKHSLKYFLTASSGVPNFPEFVGAAVVDGVQVGYCDSNLKTAEPKQDWMRDLMKDDPQHVDWYTLKCLGNQKVFRDNIDGLKRRLNQTGELPLVSLLQKSPSSPVCCHATGFYPDRASLFWRKDGEELHEDVDHGEILHNHDGTFQMSVDLKLSSVPAEDWRRYECVFQLSGVEKNIVTRLDEAVIRTNAVSPLKFPVGVAVVLLLLLALGIAGLFICCRHKSGFRLANNSSSSSSPTRSQRHCFILALHPAGLS